MRVFQRLLNLGSRLKLSHGGESGVGKRKEARPVATRRPMHVVFRSRFSLFRDRQNLDWIKTFIAQLAKKQRVHIYEFSINSNHVHLAVRPFDRKGFKDFLRIFSSQVATRMTGAKKGSPLAESFWLHPVWTRIVEWGKAFKRLLEYVIKNELEAQGAIAYYRPKLRGRGSG
jgi:putative transposase